MMEIKSKDYLKFAAEPEIKKLLETNEKLIFSSKVAKYNQSNWKQERNILITNKYIYNLNKLKVRRKISLSKVTALTLSTVETQKSKEFIIHVGSEYDYRYDSQQRKEIIEVIEGEYRKIYNKDLLIFGIPTKKLEAYVNKQNNFNKPYKLPDAKFKLLGKHSAVDVTVKPDLTKGELLYSQRAEDCKTMINTFVIVKEIRHNYNESDYLVEKKDTKETFTLRTIRKFSLLDTNTISTKTIVEETDKNLSCVFLLHPEFIFRGDGMLHIIFRLSTEKSLARLLEEEKRINERKTCFFTFQIGLAIQHLHSKNIFYKQLRPENVFLDERKYIYLNDFNTYKFLSSENEKNYISLMLKEKSSIQEYLPPEYFRDVELTTASDWWTFGILIYHLLIGITPFYSADMYACEQGIISRELSFPKPLKNYILLTDSTIAFITKLLSKDPKGRLCKSVLDHSFFKGRGWTQEEMLKKEVDISLIFLSENEVEPMTRLYPSLSKEELSKILEEKC